MNDLEKRIRLEALITEREGMIWTNRQREIEGKSIAYDDAFFDLCIKMKELLEDDGRS